MPFAHFTLPTRDVQRTAALLEEALGYTRDRAPANSPCETVWLDMGRGQQIHIVHVDGFEASPFEGEFGRHFAVYYPVGEFDELRSRLLRLGAAIFEPERTDPFPRFFFREPINGYVFEVMAQA